MNLQSVKQLAILGVASLVISCGGGDGAVPIKAAPVPVGNITGTVMLGPVSNATITAYEINPDTGKIDKENPLFQETNKTDANGEYTFTLQKKSKLPVLICATDGEYVEPAAINGNPKARKKIEGQEQLCALSFYDPKDANNNIDTIVNITFFTNLGYGIFQDKMAHTTGKGAVLDKIIPADPNVKGSKPKQVLGTLSKSNNEVAQWLNISSVVTVTPKEINRSRNVTNAVDDEYAYGLAIIGVSSVADWLGNTNAVEGEFNGMSSMILAQHAYDDIKAAGGWLDGLSGGIQHKFLDTPLNAHVYRHHFAMRILSVVDNIKINQTGLKIPDVETLVSQIANHRLTVFDPDSAPSALNAGQPDFGHQAGLGHTDTEIVTGDMVFSFTITDLSGIQSVELTLYTGKIGADPATQVGMYQYEPQDGNNSLYKWIIPTGDTGLADGTYNLQIVALPNRGQEATFEINNIQVRNGKLTVSITDPVTPGDPNSENPISGNGLKGNGIAFTADIVDTFANSIVTFDAVPFNTTLANVATVTPVFSIGTPAPLVPGAQTQNIKTKYFAYLKTVGLTDGQYQFRAKLVSNSTGLSENIFDLSPFAIDNNQPIGSFTTGQDFKVVNTPTVDLTATLEDAPKVAGGYASGMMNVAVHNTITSTQKTGSIAPSTGPVKQATISGVVLGSEGWFSLQLAGDDFAGNHLHAPTLINVAYDVTPPTITPDANLKPISDTWVRSLDVKATAKDKVGVFKIYIKEGGAPVAGKEQLSQDRNKGDKALTGTFTGIKKAQDGMTTIDIVAVDKSANPEKILSFPRIGFDFLDPVIDVLPANGAVTYTKIGVPNRFPQTGTGTSLKAPPTNSTNPAATDALPLFTTKILVSDPGAPTTGSGLKDGQTSYSVTGSTIQSNPILTTLNGKLSNPATDVFNFNVPYTAPAAVAFTGDIERTRTFGITATCKQIVPSVTAPSSAAKLNTLLKANVVDSAIPATGVNVTFTTPLGKYARTVAATAGTNLVFKKSTKNNVITTTANRLTVASTNKCYYTYTATVAAGAVSAGVPAVQTTYIIKVIDDSAKPITYTWGATTPNATLDVYTVTRVDNISTRPAAITKGSNLTVTTIDNTVGSASVSSSYCMSSTATNNHPPSSAVYKVGLPIPVGGASQATKFLTANASIIAPKQPVGVTPKSQNPGCVNPEPVATTGLIGTEVSCPIGGTRKTLNLKDTNVNFTMKTGNLLPGSGITDKYVVTYTATANKAACP